MARQADAEGSESPVCLDEHPPDREQSPNRAGDAPSLPLQGEERWRFLEEASLLLASSLDFETTLAEVVQLAVPRLADWCIIHMVEDDESIRWLATVHGDATLEETARELQRRYPRGLDAHDGVAEVVRTGQPRLYTIVTNEGREARARDPEHLRLLQAMASRSAMLVPLIARGRVLGVLSFLSNRSGRYYDLTDLQLAQDLAQRAALAVDNARLYSAGLEALRLRDEVLALISHDLLQPLSAIHAAARLLNASDEILESQSVEWLATRIDTAATRMSTMLRDLLDVAHVESGRPLELRKKPLDLISLVRAQVQAAQHGASSHEIRIETHLPELSGTWDVRRLERVVSNLLSNAIKYSPDGGQIHVRLVQDHDDRGNWAVLRVQDSGLGIPAGDLPHIFDRFHRGANVIGRISGTGIGLAGAKHIVEQHGGTITVDSEEGSGTTVTVRLPLG